MSVESRRVQMIMDAILRDAPQSAAGISASISAIDRDDCAVIPINADHDLVIGSDFVRGEGFVLHKLGLLSRKHVGGYVVGANASDLAAMGATPLGMTLVYRYGNTTTDEDFAEIIAGVTDACRRFQLPLLGGDTGSNEIPVLSATAFGLCPSGRALLRSRGRDGDNLYLTGDIGRAGAAFAYFQVRTVNRFLAAEIEAQLLGPWRNIEPAIEQGQFLVGNQLSRCAMDTSDGLFASAQLLAEASSLDVELEASLLPVADSVKRTAEFLGVDWLHLAGGVSVDFRLLFSAPPQHHLRLTEGFENRNWPLFRVGRFVRSHETPCAVVVEPNGKRRELANSW